MLEESTQEHRKVLVIGWDGADWKVASNLIDEGRMPHLQKFVTDGVMGNISTLYPILSPMLWTSIATGKRAHKHGIHGFAEPDNQGGVRPITNLGRKSKAIWNILNQSGKKCNVVGWWPSHPAEPIDGVMVSNHFQDLQRSKDGKWPMRPNAIHPARLQKQLGKFRVHVTEIEGVQIQPFVPNAADVDQEKDKRIFSIAKILAETSSIHAVSTAIMQHEPWDFMAIYHDSIDHFCHGFMKYRPPREKWIPEADFEMYKNVIDTAYEFHDLMLGVTLELAGPDTTVILLSDHGFHPDHLRPQTISNEPAGPADEHRPFGIFAMKGPGIKKDDLVFGASLLDITPTILTLFGLPVGRDMDGKPLLTVYEDPPEVEYVDSWQEVEGNDGSHPANAQVDPVDAQQALNQLIELGYVEELDEDQQVTVNNTIRELRYNLARDYMDSRRTPQAITEFSTLWEEFPDESRFGVKLFSCYLALNRISDARETLNQLVKNKQRYAQEAKEELAKIHEERGEDFDASKLDEKELRKLRKLRRRASTNSAAFAFFRASLLQAEHEFEKAIEALEFCKSAQQYNQPSVLGKLGECFAGLNRWEDSLNHYKQLLEIDPVNPDGRLGLARSYLGMKQPRKALKEALASIGLIYQNPKAHFICGRALLEMSQPKRALESFQRAVAQNPVFPDAHNQIASIYKKLGEVDNYEKHLEFAAVSQKRIEEYRSGSLLPEDVELELDIAMDQSISFAAIENDTPCESLGECTVIVSGLPRSGTSMLMQMLDAGGVSPLTDGVRKADDSNKRGYFELEGIKQLAKDPSCLSDSNGKAVKVIAQLIPHLPLDGNYRILFMERPLGEIIKSQSKMLMRNGRKTSPMSDRRLGMAFYKQLQTVRNLLEAQAIPVISIPYHEVLKAPEVAANRINDFLGGGLDTGAMAATVDSDLRNEFGTDS